MDLLQQAKVAWHKGLIKKAQDLADKAIAADSKNRESYFFRGAMRESLLQHDQAILDYDEVLKLDPTAAEIFQRRGCVHFKLGHIKESLADFDKFIELKPDRAPYHWQRGISCYYAGRFEEGRRQFERHQTVNPADAENAVWHFLCVARSADLEKARASLLPVKEDRRVPMMQIYGLFAGQGAAEEVLAAAKAGQPSPEELKHRLFYAHLYLALYCDVTGDTKLAWGHISKAVQEYGMDHYMGDVARVHAMLLSPSLKR
ncbi:MAG: tetratricopeptide repeat protein [Chloroflexi bacterium]|nr:tetratricopeptide repeat protein [Chloroflexota bacterium]